MAIYNPYLYPWQQGYQPPPVQHPITTPQTPATNNTNGIIWVQGENGAKSFLMAPNTTLQLMDSESSKFYIKSTDASGMPSLRVFAYEEITNKDAKPGEDYATKSELAALKADILAKFKTESGVKDE